MTTDRIYNMRKSQRTDPLTRVAARFPHEHATPADYAKSREGHVEIDVQPAPDWPVYTETPLRNDLLRQIMWVVCILSLLGSVGIAFVEIVLRRVA